MVIVFGVVRVADDVYVDHVWMNYPTVILSLIVERSNMTIDLFQPSVGSIVRFHGIFVNISPAKIVWLAKTPIGDVISSGWERRNSCFGLMIPPC